MSNRLTPNFTLEEFSVSASHPDLATPVPAPMRPKIERIARDILEPIRAEVQRPLRILSGYRSKELNRAVGGSVTSQHARGEAADFTATDIGEVWLAVLKMVSDGKLSAAGQLIYYPDQKFIHVALPSGRYPRPTTCVHWPERGLRYAVISPTQAAFDAAVRLA